MKLKRKSCIKEISSSSLEFNLQWLHESGKMQLSRRNSQQLCANSSEDAEHIISEKGSLLKLCLWCWVIHSSTLSLIKGIYFCRRLHKEQSAYLYTPEILQGWGWREDSCVFVFFRCMFHGLELPVMYICAVWSCDSHPQQCSCLSCWPGLLLPILLCLVGFLGFKQLMWCLCVLPPKHQKGSSR